MLRIISNVSAMALPLDKTSLEDQLKSKAIFKAA